MASWGFAQGAVFLPFGAKWVTQGELNLDSPGRNGNGSGGSPKVVSERLGHSSVAFLMDVYTASLPDMQEGAAQKLQEMLG